MLHSRQAPAPGHGLPRRRLRGSGDDSIGAAPATTAAGGTTAAASQACADAAALKASVAELDQLDLRRPVWCQIQPDRQSPVW